MSDPFRSGGFGTPGLFGGFGQTGADLGKYNIGDSGADAAYLDKLEAQLSWQNGRLGDAAYLAALERYVKATDADSSERLRAVDELESTRWSITRNEAVRKVNAAPSANARINALLSLMNLDRRRLGEMSPGNEAYREQQSRILELQTQVRTARWGQVVQRFNADQMSNAEMLAQAQRFAREARGKADEQDYLDQVTQFTERIDNEQLSEAIDAWDQRRTSANAKAVSSLYARMIGRAAADSPRAKELTSAAQDFDETVKAHREAEHAAQMQSQYEGGHLSDARWLDFLRGRVRDEDRGTPQRLAARDTFIKESYRIAATALRTDVAEGLRSPGDLIDFYGSALGVMDLDSTRAMELQQEIAQLRATGLEAIRIAQPRELGGFTGPFVGGHLVYPGGAVPDKGGFVSQYDGSQFAATNCGLAASAMLAWAVSDGKVQVSGGQLRYYSGDGEAGTGPSEWSTALSAVGLRSNPQFGMGYGSFESKLLSGKPAVLSGWGSYLPPEFRPFGFSSTMGHSVYVDRAVVKAGRTWYLVMDPLGRGGYSGQWWPEEVLQRFAWNDQRSGTAMFAGQRGASMPTRQPPPFQAFDTDWMGRSTVGRGGGTSRAEAGPRRDWRDGPTRDKPPKPGSDAAMVADFLSAIDRIEERDEAAPPTLDGGGDREKRAKTLLERNGGDPRLAAIEWFTGRTPVADPTSWSKTERWYANAVGKAVGWDRMRPAEVVPEEAVSAGETPDGAPALPGEPAGRVIRGHGGRAVVVPPPAPEPTGLVPDLEALSRGILERLGIAATAPRLRMVAAWVTAENGGQDVQGYNPLGLMTPGLTDLPGQIGKLEDGRANFDTREAGLDATARVIEADAPGLLGALRGNDPEAFVRQLADSGWSEAEGYGSAVIRAYNGLPGTTPLIANTGPRAFTAPPTLEAAARTQPQLAELLDVDPADPNQMAWFERNAKAAQQAALLGAASWTYETPSGQPIVVESSAGVTRELLRIRFDYSASVEPPTQEGQARTAAKWDDYMGSLTEIDMEAAKRFMEVTEHTRDFALLRQDWGVAIEAENEMRRTLNAVNGMPADGIPDARLGQNPYLTPADNAWLVTKIEALEPFSTDRADAEHFAPGGSALGGLIRDGTIVVEYDSAGHVVRADVDPGKAFVTQRPDGSAELHTQSTDPERFAPVTEADAVTGGDVTVPAYRSQLYGSDLIHIQSGGMDVWQPVEDISDRPFVVAYQRQYEGPSGQVAARQAQADDRPAIERDAIGTIRDVFQNMLDYNNKQPWDPRTGPGAPTVEPDPASALTESKGAIAPGTIPMYQITVNDPETNEPVTWLSFDRLTWIGWVGDPFGSKAPGLVTHGGASWGPGPSEEQSVLMVNGQPWDPKTHALGDLTHWLGDPRFRDIDMPAAGDHSVGAPGKDYMIRRTSLSGGPEAGAVFDPSLTTVDRWRSGLLTREQASTRMMGEELSLARRDDEMAIRRSEIGRGLTAASAVLSPIARIVVSPDTRAPSVAGMQALAGTVLSLLPTVAKSATAIRAQASEALRDAAQLALDAQAARAGLAAVREAATTQPKPKGTTATMPRVTPPPAPKVTQPKITPPKGTNPYATMPKVTPPKPPKLDPWAGGDTQRL